MVFEYSVIRKIPGLSTSSSSSLPTLTPVTPSRQEIDHPKSSSRSSTSTTTTVSSDSETRTREDLCRIDSYPVSVSSKHVERKEGGNPLTRLIIQITLQQSCQAKVWIDKNGETRMGWITIPQPCQVKVWKGKFGETRILLKHQKSC